MTTVYKLTRQNLTTYNDYQWVVGETRTFPGTGELCGSGWAHAYTSPALALLRNPADANYNPFRLWECEGNIGKRQAMKVGCTSLTLLREIVVPEVTTEQHIMFSLYCALAVPQHEDWILWAEKWLSGEGRSEAAAWAVAAEARAGAAGGGKGPIDFDEIAAACLLPWEFKS